MKENNKGLLGKCHVMKYQDVLTGKLTSAGEGVERDERSEMSHIFITKG